MDRRALYSQLYREGQAVLDKYNPCQIDPVAKTCRRGPLATHGCCMDCDHLGPNGCTVHALGCKLWLCGEAADAKPDASKELYQLRRRAFDQGIPYGVRASKDQNFRQDY